MKVSAQRTALVRRLAITSAALVGTALTPLPAFAQDGTWNGATADYNTAGNWTPAGVPTNIATLANTGQTTVAVTANSSINEILFAANAQQYTFINDANLIINGIGNNGIVNASTGLQTIQNFRTMTFNNNATVIGGPGTGIFFSNLSNGGSAPVLTFNNNSGLGGNVILLSFGAAVSAVGTNQVGANGSVIFNNSSHADGVTMNFAGGIGGAQPGVVSATGTGGSHNVTFNNSSHADGATITSQGGGGIVLGIFNMDPAITATATGGNSDIVFNDTSHADNAQIENRGASTSTFGGLGATTATGGNATLTLNDSSHIDGATLTNTGSLTGASGGTGAIGGGGVGAAGGLATGVGGIAFTYFNDSSHADNATIVNNGGGMAGIIGGIGGAGDTGVGGAGGNAQGTSGGATIVFSGASHANNSSFTNTNGNTYVVGGAGGVGGTTGAGGAGGTAFGSGGGTYLLFNNGTGTTGSTISNTAGDSLAIGGTGGTGGAGAVGGNGGGSSALGSNAVVVFAGTASAGTGTTITNRGGNGTATGGTGGEGGSAAGGNGGAAGAASASGGDATLTFQDNASAGNATITNISGTANATIGNGGNGAVGNGGQGGAANASGGDAIINFNNNASAGSATIVNQRGTPATANFGMSGTPGGGGGTGGLQGGSASAASGDATINFNNSATAGNATITSNGNINFNNTATGGSSRITNQSGGAIRFNDTSVFGTAAGALITNNSGQVIFANGSSLGSGTINNVTGTTAFRDDSRVGTGTINNGGTLNFQDSSDAVFGRVVNSATGVVNVGVGAFRLGSLSGSGSVVVTSTSLQVGYLDLNDTFAGVISGAGQLIKRGTGTLVLTGANTYAGNTTIAAGTLQVDGSITSNTFIVSGTTLRGIGTITGNVANSGTINAGNAANPTGTLHVTGNYQGNANSLFLVSIAGANSNLLQATGNLVLGGSTVRPQAAPGSFFLMQNDYRIAVGGSRSDTFAGIDASLLPASVTASLFYTTTEAFLRVRRNSTTFAQTAGLTPNQTAVSTSLDAAVAANNPLVFTTYLTTYNALLALPASSLPGALNILSGDALTAVPVAAQEHSNRFAHRLDAYTWSNSSNIWGLVAYGDQEADSDGNGPGFDANGLEFQMGFNTSLGANTRLGLSVGYNDGDVDISERLASADIETWSLGAQLRHDFGPVYVSGQFTYSWHSIESSRALFLAGAATAKYDASTWTAAGEIGWVIRSGNLAIEPHLSVRHASTDQDGYSEAGPVGVLDVAATEYETTRFGLGVRFANRDPAAPVRFYALARYEHETGDSRSVLDNTMPGLPTFTVFGTRLGDDIFTADVGVEFRLSQGLSLFAAGGGHTRSNETSLNANAGLRIVF